MSKARLVLTMFVAMLAFAAVNSASASASTAGWMLNGTLLSAQGLTSAALSGTGTVDEAAELNGGGLNVTCKGPLLLGSGAIEATGMASGQITFDGCTTTTANCEVPKSVGTVPVLFEVTLDGALAVKAIAKPQSGTTFATVKFSGASCSVAGVKPATGEAELLAPEGQDERVAQLLKGVQAANGLLKFNSNPASFVGGALLTLASGKPWSFL